MWNSCTSVLMNTCPAEQKDRNKTKKQRKKQVPFIMAIENGEPMQECLPKHLRMGTAIMK